MKEVTPTATGYDFHHIRPLSEEETCVTQSLSFIDLSWRLESMGTIPFNWQNTEEEESELKKRKLSEL